MYIIKEIIFNAYIHIFMFIALFFIKIPYWINPTNATVGGGSLS